ncbi:hypothetical protein DSCW_35910 [Desulfosarcina widdelii]|uniref:Uncharacterized protein n=1 Tax=Desulfosarcina widdelii TaxID=947919 RepID=A0A5K7ZCI6_9BACT|nr:hypothetical protein [Desulfosarcina widdelii]BBO76174.1 hypothetical protein DSCW_35910 [Desulfosarcina widdelii]
MEKGQIPKSSTQVQPSPGDSKEHLTDKYATCREDIAEVAIADIQPCPIIPDYKTPTLSTQPIVVRTPAACFCIDGLNIIEQTKAAGQSSIRCHIYHIAQHSIIELAIRKAAIRVMPQGGKCSYVELVRNTHRLRQALESTSDDLGMFTHGGDRRGVGFTDSKASNVRVVLGSRLSKKTTTISKYLQHGDSLNDAVMEELVNSGTPKTFFEAVQTQKDIRITALRAEGKNETAIMAEISSLVSAWWKESQRPTQSKTTPPEKPQPPQPTRTTGPTSSLTPRGNRDTAPTPRSPQIDSGGNPDPPASDPIPTDETAPKAELKRIGEALIEIADGQESPTPQQIERIRTLIVDLSALLSRIADPIGPEEGETGGAV